MSTQAQAIQIEIARKALQDVINPIAAMQRDMPAGYKLDGMAAIRASENPETYREIACKALAAIDAAAVQPTSDFLIQIRDDAYERAANVCDGVNNHDNPMTSRDCADAIRAFKGLLAQPAPLPQGEQCPNKTLKLAHFAATDSLEKALTYFKENNLHHYDTDKICERILACQLLIAEAMDAHAQPVAAQPAPWEPKFDATESHEQERLAIKFSMEIAGKRGGKPSPPCPVRLLEMAEALYLAERNECATPPAQLESKDAERYEYLLDCDYIAASKYLPNMSRVEYHAKLRAKHDAAIAASKSNGSGE